jgi:hypothetical protein
VWTSTRTETACWDGRLYQLAREHYAVRERTLEITFLEPGAEAYARESGSPRASRPALSGLTRVVKSGVGFSFQFRRVGVCPLLELNVVASVSQSRAADIRNGRPAVVRDDDVRASVIAGGSS